MSKDLPKLPDVKLIIKNPAGAAEFICYEDVNFDLFCEGGITLTLKIKKRGSTFTVKTESSPTYIMTPGQTKTIEIIANLTFSAEKIIH